MIDLSKINKPFGELEQPAQEALKEYARNGGQVQCHDGDGVWMTVECPLWYLRLFYRAAPDHYTAEKWQLGMPAAYRCDPFTEVGLWTKPDADRRTYCVLSQTPTGEFHKHTADGRWLVGVVSDLDLVPLQTKPARKPSVDWSHVGPEINHVARDAYGDVWGATEALEAEGNIWVTNGAIWLLSGVLASYDPGDVDWQDSQITRPGHEGDE